VAFARALEVTSIAAHSPAALDALQQRPPALTTEAVITEAPEKEKGGAGGGMPGGGGMGGMGGMDY
jgi:chaperonin GroEL